HLRVRRFFCDAADCGKRTFGEQIPGLTFRYGRCTVPLRKVREAVALALGGRAGARLAEHLSAGIGRDALVTASA
ncbi:ISL3 family transposase, partial [Kitasatospora sp. NPDC054768]